MLAESIVYKLIFLKGWAGPTTYVDLLVLFLKYFNTDV